MSDDRRRQQRAEQVRRRRQQRPAAVAPASSDIELPGIFGWMQRNGRIMVLTGIVVLIGSVGGSFLLPNTPITDDNRPTATPTATPEPGKPVGTPGPDGVVRRYAAAPALAISPNKSYTAVMRTEKGDITLELFPDTAPIGANNFIFLARNRFFDGLTFHRVIPGFVAQGGDPLGNGTGGPGYSLPVEKNNVPFEAGVIAMASSAQSGVSGSQFFITMAPQPALEPQFSAFGRVTSGLEVVQALTTRNPQERDQPPGDRILKVEIIEKDK